jgi:hypothetical protein
MEGIKIHQNAAEDAEVFCIILYLGEAVRWIFVQWLWRTNFGGPGSPIELTPPPKA